VGGEPRRIGRRALFGRLLPQPKEAGPWVQAHRTALACRFEVALPTEDARHLETARAALDEVGAIEDALSRFRDTSELSRVNRGAANAPVAVGPSLFALLSLCKELHAATGGAFDPASSGLDEVTMDGLSRTVRFAAPGVQLDLGEVGRGWALDRVAATLRVRGVLRALLAAGDSHRGWGGEAWELALRPGGEDLGLLRLRDAALGTFAAAGRPVLDPRTGRPATGVRSASVVASEAAVANALATAFLVGGPELAAPFCASRPGTVGLLVTDARPRQILAFGKRDGVTVEPATGIRVVEAPA
jgi:thiamine biosynthesis lipoprotein